MKAQSINITFLGSDGLGFSNFSFSNNSFHISYPCFDHRNCAPYQITFEAGLYFVELVGGGGGRVKEGLGGKGGKSSGVLSFKDITTAFLYLGGAGLSKNDRFGTGVGGFNGGGTGNADRGGGGGGSDIRLIKDDFTSRIIVAGGGGGGYHDGANNIDRGRDGGGLNGTSGGKYLSYNSCYGTQNGCDGGVPFSTPEYGAFGEGNKAGGGGFWGGGGDSGCGGGGGSGYIGGCYIYPGISTPFSSTFDNSGNGYAIITPIVHCNCMIISSVYNHVINPLLFLIVIPSLN